jgi:hypothetical protein
MWVVEATTEGPEMASTYEPEHRVTVRTWMRIAAKPVNLAGRVHSDELGMVSIPERDCPETGIPQSGCDCDHCERMHAERNAERCEVTGYAVAECGCPTHRDHPDL